MESGFQGLRVGGPKASKLGCWSFKNKRNRQRFFVSVSASMSEKSAKLAKQSLGAVSWGIKVPKKEVEEQVGCKSGPR